MKIHVNFKSELEDNVLDQINFIKGDFNILFGKRTSFTQKDRDTAIDILHYLSKSIDTPKGVEFLSETLEALEETYPTLF